MSSIPGHVSAAGRQDPHPLLAVRIRLGSRLDAAAAAAAIAGSVATAALVRLPFLSTGIGPDEGGYAYIASRWAQGARLYGLDWVDRPQGLMVAYRLLLDIGHSAWAIRLGALLFGCGITLLLGIAGWLLAGPRAGAAAALVYAVVGVAPHLQGFTFNGELAAALPSTAAVTAALAWRRDRRLVWLVLAGAAGATGILMKQSGFDGLAMAAFVVLADRRAAGRRGAAALLLGAAVPLGLSAAHGLLVGWSNYWFAVVGYKLSAPSGASTSLATRLTGLGWSWGAAERDLLLPVAVAAALAVTAAIRGRSLRVPLVWLAAAFAGFNAASLYWPHYYVQLLAPLALLIGVGVASAPGRATALAALALVVGPALFRLNTLDQMSTLAREHVIPYFGQYLRDEAIARQVDRYTRPGQPIYALDSEADLYFLADRPADFPYLWAHPLEEVPGALGRLRALLDGSKRPSLVVVFRSPRVVDPTGKLSRILAGGYRPLEEVGRTGVELLERA